MIVAVVTTIQAITNKPEKKLGTSTEKKLGVGVNLQLLEL